MTVSSLVAVLCGLVLAGCGRHPATTSSPSGHITSKKTGKVYSYIRVADSDDEFEKFEAPPPGLAAGPDDFRGTARNAAKTSISSGPTKSFSDLASLLRSGLFLPDSQMTGHHPPITLTSPRVEEEEHNAVVTAYLYASSKEPDNDYHCILGTVPGQPSQFLTAEVSGLPLSGPAHAQLTSVRDKFKEFFGQNNLPGKGYSKFDPPIPLKITGSIFFDIDHPPGAVGPTGLKPATAWEIHPVTDIEFEP